MGSFLSALWCRPWTALYTAFLLFTGHGVWAATQVANRNDQVCFAVAGALGIIIFGLFLVDDVEKHCLVVAKKETSDDNP